MQDSRDVAGLRQPIFRWPNAPAPPANRMYVNSIQPACVDDNRFKSKYLLYVPGEVIGEKGLVKGLMIMLFYYRKGLVWFPHHSTNLAATPVSVIEASTPSGRLPNLPQGYT